MTEQRDETSRLLVMSATTFVAGLVLWAVVVRIGTLRYEVRPGLITMTGPPTPEESMGPLYTALGLAGLLGIVGAVGIVIALRQRTAARSD